MRRANLWLRLPTRVLLRLGEIEARDFRRLRRGVAALPLGRLPRGARVAIRAAASKSRLYHTGAIAEQVVLGLGDAIGAVAGDGADAFDVLVRGRGDVFTVSLDTSGARLHQRGWRRDGGEAPLRETLAAALLALAGHADDEPLCDPLCGSGTIVVEAALRAIGRAPGVDRTFAFERFADHDARAWAALRDEARARERPRALPIYGADADPEQIAAARRNAERAGVAAHVTLEVVPLSAQRAPTPRGLVASNPPYGRRVGAKGGALPPLYAALGAMLRGPFSGWRAALLVEDRRLLSRIGGIDAGRAVMLSNGGLRVWVASRPATGPSAS